MKYVLSIIPAIIAAATAAAPQIQALLVKHPVASAIVAALYAILAHWAPSPLQTGK